MIGPKQKQRLTTLGPMIQDNPMIERIKATNPYSGQSEMLTPEEHKLYIEIKEAELNEDYSTMQKGLSKFSRLNAKAYMTLLDQPFFPGGTKIDLPPGVPNHF